MSKSIENEQRTALVASEAASRLDGVRAGVACAGTAIEAKTYTVSGKAFLFVCAKNLRLKLQGAIAEASAAARRSPSSIQVGSGGWTTLKFGAELRVDDATLKRWVAESHALFQNPAGRLDAPKPRPKATVKTLAKAHARAPVKATAKVPAKATTKATAKPQPETPAKSSRKKPSPSTRPR